MRRRRFPPTTPPVMPDSEPNKFEEARGGAGRSGFFRDYLDFLAHNKKWWMLPILVVLLLLGALIILGETGAAPFIYSLF